MASSLSLSACSKDRLQLQCYECRLAHVRLPSLPKSQLQFGLHEVLDVNWRLDALGEQNSAGRNSRAWSFGKSSRTEFLEKLGCAVRGLDTFGPTTTTDLLRVAELYNGDYRTTS